MSGVFTKDITRALRFAKNLDTGVVGVNCVSYMNMQVSRSRIVFLWRTKSLLTTQ